HLSRERGVRRGCADACCCRVAEPRDANGRAASVADQPVLRVGEAVFVRELRTVAGRDDFDGEHRGEEDDHERDRARPDQPSNTSSPYGNWRAGDSSRFHTMTLRRKKQTSSARWLMPLVSTVTIPRLPSDVSFFSMTFVTA